MPSSAIIDVDLIQRSRPYQSSLFVNRGLEIETVATKVSQAQNQDLIDDSVVNFWGVKGIGKTWILQELQHRYAYRPGQQTLPPNLVRLTFALIFSFPNEPAPQTIAQIARELSGEALTQLSTELSAPQRADLIRARDQQDIDAFVKVILTLSHRFVPLILLDNTDKAQHADWERIEQSLIEPLVSTGRVLVVVAGRRQVPRWRLFEVRRRVMEPEQSRVRPFDKTDVRKQLAQHQFKIPIDLFFPYTAGNPHLVDAIARHIANWTQDSEEIVLDQRWFDQHNNALLQILRASEAQLLENVPAALLPILDAVSPLRFYRLEALRFMLTQATEVKQSDGYYLNILRLLDQQTEVVWWDRKRRAYVTSQIVRQLVSRRQLLEDRDSYVTKHHEAYNMYWGLVRDYPKASEDFISEILYHLVCLYMADSDLNHLRSKSIEAIQFACKHLNSDRLLVIQKQLGERKNDPELHDMLPETLHTELIHQLDPDAEQ